MKIFFFYFISISSFVAQELNTITYKAFTNYKARDSSFEDFETNYNILSGNAFFELNFNKNESAFQFKEHTTTVTDSYLKSFISRVAIYKNYYDKSLDMFFFKHPEDWMFEGFDKYLVNYQNLNPWVITNISKIID